MRTPNLWPANRVCVVCAASFFPKATVQVYCSVRCREAAKYRRLRDDPDKWAAYLASIRSRYEPTGRPPGRAATTTGCAVAGCDGNHLARGFCRKHYYRDRRKRGLDRGGRVEIIGALVKHYDASGEFTEDPRERRLVARVSSTYLVPDCPDCGGMMYRLSGTTQDIRDCAACGVRAMLNPEEVSWLTSGAPSTEWSRPTKNFQTT